MPTLSAYKLAYERQRTAYLELRQRWRDSPLLYVRQRFGLEPTGQQAEILEAILPYGAKVSVRSGHGIGKSAVAAHIVCWFLETMDFAKVPCTAPTAHQLRDILWGELAKWRRKADELSQARGDHPRFYISKLFKLTQDRLYDLAAQEWAATARTARKENPEALQGFHADNLLFVIDEASGVPEEVFEAAEGALSTPGARVLMLGNATRTSGTFHASHNQSRGDYTALHFRSQDSPLVDPGFRPRLVRKWGENSNVVRVRADGEFPKQEDDLLISLEHTEPCLTRERVAGEGKRKLGVDVARFGSDRITLVLRQGRVVDHIKIYAKQGTMETVGCVIAVIESWQVQEIDVDVIGIGAGVYDRLVEVMAERRRLGQYACDVVAVNVSHDAPDKKQGEDAQARLLRDYLWLQMARWLKEEAPVFCAEDKQTCEDLAGELASVRYKLDSDGRIVVEDKDAMRKRLGHSPDIADGLGCTFAPPAEDEKRAGTWGRR
jgi:phage terminase large subunit